MSKWSWGRGAALLCGLCLVTGLGLRGALADDKEKKELKIESKAAEAKDATSVNFSKDLGLSLGNLKTLGQRIDAARAAPDPVALALAAKELEAAEQVSGKKASLTSADLVKEATELARLRNMPDELKAVAKLIPDGKGLEEQAEKTAKEIQRRKEGETPKSITGYLKVVNTTRWYIDIYVNGFKRVTVAPFHYVDNIYVGDPAWTYTRLYGAAPGTTLTWGARDVGPENYAHYTWTLYQR